MSESKNPYIGPRTFATNEGDRFFGRDREAADLFSLVVSSQLVLLYAQSGAGKSSLINADLIPRLKEYHFEVLPVARVGGKPPDDIELENVFVYNVIASIEQRDKPNGFHNMSLTNYLNKIVFENGKFYFDDEAELAEDNNEIRPRLLIIDQFEEILTSNLAAWPKRADFFKQLRKAMEDDPYLWVLLSIREDYVAALAPYAHLLPGQLQPRYYMQRMKVNAAIEAINQPMELYGNGRKFAHGVAEALAEDLSQIQGEHGTGMQLGEFIEPVQLQVACYQLWENLKGRPVGEITKEDLRKSGGVNAALAQFYTLALQNVVENGQGTITQLEIRNWIEQNLITESQKRDDVSQGSEKTAGLANEHVQSLQNQFLLRSTQRAGSTRYEIVHDRFVDPIFQSNLAWRRQQGEVLSAAEAWKDNEKDNKLLYQGLQLINALHFYNKQEDLDPLIHQFLDASKKARRKRGWRWMRYVGLGVVVLSFLLYRWVINLEPFSTSIAFPKDGSNLIVTTNTNGIFFYDLTDLDNPLQREDHAPNSAAYVAITSPDGEMLATGSSDNTIRLWDLTDPDRPSKMLGGDGGFTVTQLAFSPDGKHLASVEIYGTAVKLWVVHEPNRPPQELDTENYDDITFIEFSPDGRYLVVVEEQERVYLWQISNLDAGPRLLIDTDN